MNSLPENWKVKNTGEIAFDCIIQYLNKNYRSNREYWIGNSIDAYYGVYLNQDFCSSCYENKCITLSIEEFITLSKEIEEFPEKWCVKDCVEVSKWASELFNCFDSPNPKAYLCIDQKDFPQRKCYYFLEDHKGYIEITFEQFKKHVLKENSMETNKEIIGAFCIKDFPNNRFGVHTQDYTGVDFVFTSQSWEEYKPLKYPEYWKIKYKEEEFKVGDIVKVTKDGNNASQCNSVSVPAGGIYFDKNWKNNVYKINRFCTKYGNGFIKCNIYELFYLDGRNAGCVYSTALQLASPEEIKEYENNLLLEEAKRRYPVGTKFESASSEGKICYVEHIPIFKNGLIGTKDNGLNGIIYKNGKWAEILPSYPQITINGYTGEFFDDYVRFGCAQIDREVFIDLFSCKEYCNTNRDIESVTIGKGTFSKKQIKEIALYYLEKK